MQHVNRFAFRSGFNLCFGIISRHVRNSKGNHTIHFSGNAPLLKQPEQMISANFIKSAVGLRAAFQKQLLTRKIG